MNLEELKQDLRHYIEEKLKYSIPIKLAKAGAVIGGIYAGSKAVDAASELYKKNLEKKAKERKKKKANEFIDPLLKGGNNSPDDGSFLVDLPEDKTKPITGVWKHRKMIAKLAGKAALGAAAWTAGEKLISTGAAVKKREDRIKRIARLRAARALSKEHSKQKTSKK